jgi:hypothetical protein
LESILFFVGGQGRLDGGNSVERRKVGCALWGDELNTSPLPAGGTSLTQPLEQRVWGTCPKGSPQERLMCYLQTLAWVHALISDTLP